MRHPREPLLVMLMPLLFASNSGTDRVSTKPGEECLRSLSAVVNERPRLVFRACPLADIYTIGEPIRVALLLMNTSDRWGESVAVRPVFRLGADVFATIIGPSGDTLAPIGQFIPPTAGVVELHGGYVLGRVLDLTCEVKLPEGPCLQVYRFDNPGEYVVTFSLHVVCGPGGCDPRWLPKRELIAPALRIRVRARGE